MDTPVEPYDIAVGALSVAPAVMSVSANQRVLDDQNVEDKLYERMWRLETWRLRKIARFLDWRAVRRYERRWIQAPDAVTVCSQRDSRRLALGAPGQRFHVVPNGVDLQAIAFQLDDREPDTVLFVGGMSWRPNIEAAQVLVRDVMPAVWAQRPNTKVWLVGKDPAFEVIGLAGALVTVTGEVESVLPYLRRASVTVVPLQSAGGTRLKILEAMAAGVPVVTTSVGAEGLDLRHGEDAVIAESAAGLSAATVHLLSDPQAARTLATAARTRVEAEFGWDRSARRLSTVFV
jgi:glycosyltransferase involved in cell wall biosynthesis